MDIVKIEECIKEMTTAKRFLHSKGVEETAVKLARHYGVDEKKARYAGLVKSLAANLIGLSRQNLNLFTVLSVLIMPKMFSE